MDAKQRIKLKLKSILYNAFHKKLVNDIMFVVSIYDSNTAVKSVVEKSRWHLEYIFQTDGNGLHDIYMVRFLSALLIMLMLI